MKYKALLITQVLIILGFGAVWIVIGHRLDEDRRASAEQLSTLSHTVSKNKSELDELRAVNSFRETNLATARTEYGNELVAVVARNNAAADELAKIEAEAKASDEITGAELARLDKQNVDLELRQRNLDAQSTELQNSMTNIDARIKELKMKLASATSDREILSSEMKELTEKKNGEKLKLDSLAAVTRQMSQVKGAIAAARNYELVRRGVYAHYQKASERLIHPSSALPPDTNLVWQIRVNQDGSVSVTTEDSTNTTASLR